LFFGFFVLRAKTRSLDSDVLVAHGFITRADAEELFRLAAPGLPQDMLAVAFEEADLDRDDRVSFRDFEHMMAGAKRTLHSEAR
jgi:hypothetical protein